MLTYSSLLIESLCYYIVLIICAVICILRIESERTVGEIHTQFLCPTILSCLLVFFSTPLGIVILAQHGAPFCSEFICWEEKISCC